CDRCSAGLSGSARPAGASARVVEPCVLTRPVRERRHERLGVRARRGDRQGGSNRSPDCPYRRSSGPCCRCSGGRYRGPPSIRGLAASTSRQRRAGTGVGALVATIPRPLSLLLRPQLPSRTPPRLHRFRQVLTANRSRRAFLSTFPTLVFGIASTNSIRSIA